MLGIALALFPDQENNGSQPPTLIDIGQNNKENILFKDPLQSILVKGVAIETSLAISLQRPPSIDFGKGGCQRDQSGDSHKDYGIKRSQSQRGRNRSSCFWSSRLTLNKSAIPDRVGFGLIVPTSEFL
jgi:hypothetical protein